VNGVAQPAPAPRFARSTAGEPRPPVPPGHDTDAVLSELGRTQFEIDALRGAGTVA
jgi:alpha-methylacyl-CoA racemase